MDGLRPAAPTLLGNSFLGMPSPPKVGEGEKANLSCYSYNATKALGKNLTAPHRPQLQLERVSLTDSRGLHHLLQDISWEIGSGDRWGVIGPSGAGKTSLLRLLNRLSDPSSGSIFLEGQLLQTLASVGVRRRVMLVPQEPRLLGMTVRETLAYPLKLRGTPVASLQDWLAKTIQQFDIPQEWLDRTEQQLSVGQRQWVSLARAWGSQPEVLLLDEPTSALDAGRIEQLVAVLRQLPQTTVILVSHQLEVVQQVCDRVLYLDKGRVVYDLQGAEINWEQLRATFQQQASQLASEWD